ncbi:DUF3139 domain-containing protein [Paenibacillus amylolyticus]|uniref:DUF3139 domain-containing protein n=1 Tax=Paenibacillus amylolyticus TaxID=1451 RepID=A0A100VHT5_PAEAM|nr:DUF3139 domain-containing protein [Paenibacillus amylolyticus]GAS80054.1 unknown protein [Paenibacillus amylolyticus]
MSKTFKATSVVILAVILGLSCWVYFGLLGNPLKKNEAEQQVTTYLMEQKGYSHEQLIEIKGTYSSKSSEAPYGASVTFADEPEAKYQYIIFNNGEIKQYSHTSDHPKHEEPMVR